MGMLRRLGPWCLLLLAGCASASFTSSTLGERAVFRVGDIAEFRAEDLRVGFTAVREDSRCPPDVVCFWEGAATVVAWAEKDSLPRQEVVLSTTDRTGHSKRADYLGYQIELLDVAPPNSGSVQQSDYRVTLVVRAK